MNINAPNIEYFESFADEITSKFRRLQNLVGHPTASGDYHEEVLRSVIRGFVSKRFSVKRGFIYAGKDKVSKQLDIIIIDENFPAAYIFQEDDFAIVVPDAVCAVIEVKTTLNASNFDMSINNIASAKELVDDPTKITGLVFGFDATDPNNENLDVWFKRPEVSKYYEKAHLTPDAILFFKGETLLVKCNDQARIGSDGRYYHRFSGSDENDAALLGVAYQLSVLLALIVNSCEAKSFTSSDTFDDRNAMRLFQADRGGLEPVRFEFGKGIEEVRVENGYLVPKA